MIRVAIAAAYADLTDAQSIAARLQSKTLSTHLICAGAPEGQPLHAFDFDVTLVLWSSDARTSLWVRRAAQNASERQRLVEATLGGEVPPLPRAAPPLVLSRSASAAVIARLSARLRRTAQGRPQQSALIGLAGPAFLTLLVAAALASPFLLRGGQSTSAKPVSEQVVAERDLPPPSVRNAPAEPTPTGNGMGGPLLEAVPQTADPLDTNPANRGAPGT
jgi:hypothetical protein